MADESWRAGIHRDLEADRARKRRAKLGARPFHYGEKEWQERRDAHKAAHPWCAGCLACGRGHVPATVADHIVPGDYAGPLQSLCQHCHDTVKRKLDNLFKAGKLSAQDLDMRSAKAIEMSRRHLMRGCDVRGRPIDPLHPWHRASRKG